MTTFAILTRRGRERVREVFTGRKVSSLSSDELTLAHAAGYEPHGSDHDYLVGRDPRTMTQDELRAMAVADGGNSGEVFGLLRRLVG